MFNILVGTQKISQIELPSCDKNNLSNTIFLLSKMGFFFFNYYFSGFMFSILIGTQNGSQIEVASFDKSNLTNTILCLAKWGFFL